MNNAVITGFGSVCGFGVGVPALLQGLLNGDNAIKRITSFDVSSFPVQMAGEVSNELTSGAINQEWLVAHGLSETSLFNNERIWRDRKTVFGLLAAKEAWEMAGCGEAEQDANLLLALGLEQAYLEDFAPLFSEGHIQWPQLNSDASLEKNRYFRAEVDLCAYILRENLQLCGQVIVNASACAAGGLALAQAASLIERGATEIVVCGGADSMVNPFGLGGMTRLGAPSPRNSPDACRPFDRRRDGLVIGEGAAVFIVESENRARSRGVKILAHIAGYASNQDAYRITAPRPDGAYTQRVMQAALHKAKMQPEEIDYINAHGTGTPLNDVAEARAIRACFGLYADNLPVSSIKGAIGHLMAASGIIEAAACILSLQHDFLPATCHYSEPDPECEINVIGTTPRMEKVNAILSNSFGFGGQNVSLILARLE
jgi:3-oxoacyl-[acyl-carrier-protein] synthase II